MICTKNCQFNLAHELKKTKNVLTGTKTANIKKQTVMGEIKGLRQKK